VSCPRRRLLAAVLAMTAGVAAGCTGSPDGQDPPGPSASPDPALLRDEIAEGVTVTDRNFSTFPLLGGDTAKRIVGAAAVFRNTTDQPMRVHVRFRFVDSAGRGWYSQEQDDWTAIVNAGSAYLPPGRSVDLGGIHQVSAADAARVARVVMYVAATPAKQSALLPAKIVTLTPRPAPTTEFDYVTFEVDNPGFEFKEPDYAMVFRAADGRLIGGFFVDRANWIDIRKSLPEAETDRYPQGTSRHTVPTWLPAGITPAAITMYVWP
jgi:hypothetical protein